jgi:hypothetical protein
MTLHEIIRLLAHPDLKKVDATLKAALAGIAPAGEDDRDWERLGRRDRVIRARQAVADQAGDVDAFIDMERLRPERLQDGERVAERLLKAGRMTEALAWVRRPRRPGLRVMGQEDVADGFMGIDLADHSRISLEVRILAAQGNKAAAQDLRWRTFEQTLDANMLRDYIANLPDFEEFDALDRAFAHVTAHPHHYRALAFFIDWPKLDLAAKLVLEHRSTWEGRHYGALAPAAETLEHDHPVAATVLYRALINDILARSRSQAYGHAARYFVKIAFLDISDAAAIGLDTHYVYQTGLRKAHGRKYGFWSLLESAP